MSSFKLSNFFPTPRFLKFSYVGMHITNEAIRYVELYNSGSGFKLGRFGIKNFSKPMPIFENTELKNHLKVLRKKEGS